jgi:Uma2 family endonuclease
VDRRNQPDGVDLAMEVVSRGEEARERDLETKRVEYAAAKIPEYWIVDPELETITVLRLEGDTYSVHSVFATGTRATSTLLQGFEVEVDKVFAAGKGAV